MDAGLTLESLIISISGSELNESACGFSKDQEVSEKEVFHQIINFKEKLLKILSEEAHRTSLTQNSAEKSLRDLVHQLKKFHR